VHPQDVNAVQGVYAAESINRQVVKSRPLRANRNQVVGIQPLHLNTCAKDDRDFFRLAPAFTSRLGSVCRS